MFKLDTSGNDALKRGESSWFWNAAASAVGPGAEVFWSAFKMLILNKAIQQLSRSPPGNPGVLMGPVCNPHFCFVVEYPPLVPFLLIIIQLFLINLFPLPW